jgi:formylglycine-generating enzyme required for sulfatase activity
MMGSDQISDEEKSVHRVELTRGYFLARYPVTNQEYRSFLDAGGYQNPAWWDEAGTAFLEKERIVRPAWWDDARLNGPNQPVVGVSWWEARAFCRWLTETLEDEKPSWWRPGSRVCLPSEAQWEYAARGTTGRTYPWPEGQPDERRANFDQRLGKTSPVGIYLTGATPEGLRDMAGNVLEWCLDIYDAEAYKKRSEGVSDPINQDGDSLGRCLRGGAWRNDAGWLAAAFRYRVWARLRSNGVGFRCCVVAVSAE